ncbi:MAG: response regulator receiver protein [Pedosphaera sp.]|nr:response regulator receiver protein [Pedosphaera sp.]
MPTVLHVEDQKSDRLLIALAFKRNELPVNLHGAEDGEKALEYLQGIGIYANRDEHPFPDLVLLDLKLPRKSGPEVLAWIRSQPELNLLPVIILSSSDQKVDREQAREAGATCYFCKPVALAPLKEMIKEIYSKWLA